MTKALSDLLDQALAKGVVVKGGGGWLSFGEQKLAQGIEKSVQMLADKPDLVTAIMALVEGTGSKDHAAGVGVSSSTQHQPASKAPKGKRTFSVISPLHHDGESYAIEDDVDLDHAQFLLLKASGVVAGDWTD